MIAFLIGLRGPGEKIQSTPSPRPATLEPRLLWGLGRPGRSGALTPRIQFLLVLLLLLLRSLLLLLLLF